MHDDLDYLASVCGILRSVLVKLEGDVALLSLCLVHEEALIHVVEYQAFVLGEAEQRIGLIDERHLLLQLTALLVHDDIGFFRCQVDCVTIPEYLSGKTAAD